MSSLGGVMRRTIAAGFGLFLSGVAPAGAASIPELAALTQSWAREWQARHLDAVLELYAPDAVFINADGSRVAGKPALRQFFKTVLEQYKAEPTVASVTSEEAGDLGTDWGGYHEVVTPIGKAGNPIETHGTYLVIARRSGGRWLIEDQMWTGSTPVPVKR
jgi:uncharacterized protein (TIGR02246 family)